MSFLHTAKNHRQYVRDAIAKAQRSLDELAQRERNLVRPDGFPRYTPIEEQERRTAIEARRQEILAERDEVIESALEVGRNAKTTATANQRRIAVLQESPIRRLTAAEAANVAALVSLLEAGFARSSSADVLAHIRATLVDTNRDQQVASLEVLQRRMSTAEGPHRVEYESLQADLLGKLRDPELARQRADLETDIREADDLVADVNEQARPLRVEAEQQRLVATGQYGARISEPMPVRNIGEALVFEMIEQA